MTETTQPDAVGTGEPSNIAQIIWERSKISWPDAKNIADAILSALAPHLAAPADVRRMALEEAAQVARSYDVGRSVYDGNGTPIQSRSGKRIADAILDPSHSAHRAVLRALAGSPPSTPVVDSPPRFMPVISRGSSPDYDDAVMEPASEGSYVRYEDYQRLAAAPQPPEPAEDVAAVSKAEFKFYYDRLFGRVVETAKQRDAAETALAEAKAEIERKDERLKWTTEELVEARAQLLDHDRLLGEAQRITARFTAERDRLAEATRLLHKIVRDFPLGTLPLDKQDEMWEADRIASAALSSLSAPEQPAEPSDHEISDLARIIAKEVNPHGWVNMSIAEREGCCAAARMAIQANTPRAVLAAKRREGKGRE